MRREQINQHRVSFMLVMDKNTLKSMNLFFCQFELKIQSRLKLILNLFSRSIIPCHKTAHTIIEPNKWCNDKKSECKDGKSD